MSALDDFDAISSQIAGLKDALGQINDDDVRSYLKVRDILEKTTGGLQLVNGLEGADSAAAAAGTVSHFRFVHKCAMVGLFEPEPGSDASAAYDPAAVQRFADLGG